MIKLIEENKSVLFATCPSCFSEFTLDNEDIIYLHSFSNIRGFICPICSDHVTTCEIEKISERKLQELIKVKTNNQ